MAFNEVRLPVGYDRMSTGGPTYNTLITRTNSGREYRTPRWSASLGAWELGNRNVPGDVLDTLVDFVRACYGRADGFRFKDWGDYQAAAQAVTLDASPSAQLVKRYPISSSYYDRTITKPVAGVTFTRGGSAYTTPTVDTTTGKITWAADVSQAPSAVTTGTTTVCTVADASVWAVGDIAWVSAPGQTAQAATVQAVDTTANTITLLLDSSTWTWTSGGTVALYPQPSETILWSGEFDVPARFDTDEPKWQLVQAPPSGNGARSEFVFYLQTLPVVEIRL
jgi:uncharacterized protein (TIGR02217 family)